MEPEPRPEVLFQAERFQVVRPPAVANDPTAPRREIIQHPGAVVILPLLADGRVCLIRNRRVAVGQTLWELPAGTREPNEDPAVTAARELHEETGYRCGQIERLRSFFMSPGILSEEMIAYVATNLTAGEQQLESGEQISVVPQSWAEIFDLIDREEICDAKTLVVLLDYARRHGLG